MTQATCRQCGDVFTKSANAQRYCPVCREVQAEVEAARRERGRQKRLARYGACQQCCEPAAGYSGLCRHHQTEAEIARIREERRQRVTQTETHAVESNTKRAQFTANFSQLSEGEQWRVIARAIEKFAEQIAEQDATEELHPEEQPHAEQERIDATARELLEGIAL